MTLVRGSPMNTALLCLLGLTASANGQSPCLDGSCPLQGSSVQQTSVYLPGAGQADRMSAWPVTWYPAVREQRARFVLRTRAVGPLTQGIGGIGMAGLGGGYVQCPCGCRRGSRE